jgi:flagellar biogenesis protein FliO|tara:strand:- start:1450 stop:2043 length:594 start_codon:yes stop_codon:yes gene_type:complete
MDPITIGTAIGACKAAVNTAKSIQELSHSLQDLWTAETDYNEKKRNRKKEPVKATSRMQQIIRRRAREDEDAYGDDTSIANVATAVLAEKENQIALEELAIEIDKKWGKGTWDKIRLERARRIKARHEAKKEAALRAKQKKEQDDAFIKKVLIESGKVILLIIFILGLIYGLIWAKDREKSNRFPVKSEVEKLWNLV